MDVAVTPATDPVTILVGQSSVNLGAKAKTSVCCSVGLVTVTVLAVFM